MKKIVFLIFLFTITLLAGCNTLSNDSEDSIIVRIDPVAESYNLDRDTEIGLLANNLSSNTIYYSTCDSGTIEEIEDSNISQSVVYENPCECICTFPIKSGKVDTIQVEGYLIQEFDELQFSKDLRYRVFPHFYTDQDLSRRISLSAIEMSPIVITRKRQK